VSDSPKLQVSGIDTGYHGYAHMSIMTTLCAKAVGQLGNDIKAGKGPHIFSNEGPTKTKSGTGLK